MMENRDYMLSVLLDGSIALEPETVARIVGTNLCSRSGAIVSANHSEIGAIIDALIDELPKDYEVVINIRYDDEWRRVWRRKGGQGTYPM